MEKTIRNIKEYSIHLFRSVLFWLLAASLYGFVRHYAIEYDPGIEIVTSYSSFYQYGGYFTGYVIAGFLIGMIYGTTEFCFDKYISKRISMGLSILIQAIIFFVALVFISEMVIRLSSFLYEIPLEIETGWWLEDKSFLPLLTYIFFASFAFSLIVVLVNKFGSRVFFRVLMGYYKNPREENRVFMFLDLKNSTGIAEKTGHLKFSQLLQDCFYDLNEVSGKYKAEIYQYVGDEAVISWPLKEGIKNQNCLSLFFAFQEKLSAKAAYYKKRYGLTPTFKAGLHCGDVTATEVGLVKKDLAFHGDVVNTAARIQAECNKYGVVLLISEKLLGLLDTVGRYKADLMGRVLLRGKQKELEIFEVCLLQNQKN